MEKRQIIGIIGNGFVGKAICHGFAQIADFRIYDVIDDLRQHSWEQTWEDSEFIFVCVPTPINLEENRIDLSIMDSVIEKGAPFCEGTDKVIIIKSTVVPGTVERYIEKFPDVNFIFNPEFLTEKNFKEDFDNQSRIILGGDKEEALARTEQLYKKKFQEVPIWIVDVTSAQFVKYMSNCFLSVKVSFFNEIYQICQKLGVDYDRLRDMLLDDIRIGKSHVYVPGHDGKLGFGGKCFPKDLLAMIDRAEELGIDPIVMKAAWNKNKQVREDEDWLTIKGATS